MEIFYLLYSEHTELQNWQKKMKNEIQNKITIQQWPNSLIFSLNKWKKCSYLKNKIKNLNFRNFIQVLRFLKTAYNKDFHIDF